MAEQQPQGTEYTLQGVMRFLQTEWHAHERARNTWDIERAELKAKIAKQEGDYRNSKKLGESLDRHVRMLEKALKTERAKSRALAQGKEAPAGDAADKTHINGSVAGISPEQNGSLDLEVNPQAGEFIDADNEALKDRSRQFLQKCVEELTYILTPPANPAPADGDPALNSAAYVTHQDARFEEALLQQQQMKRNQQSGVSHHPSLPNHHPPPVRQPPEFTNSANLAQSLPQAPLMTRQAPHQPLSARETMAATEEILPHLQQPSAQRPMDDQVEQVTHSFDSYGHPISSHPEGDVDLSRSLVAEDTDGWNFDDPSLPLEPQSDAAPRRPDTDLFPAASTSIPPKSPTRPSPSNNRRRSSGSSSMSRKRSDGAHELRDLSSAAKGEPANFKVRFALRGHLDVVRSIIFTGGGSPSEPEICTTGDDGTIKRWIIPSNYNNFGNGAQPNQQPQGGQQQQTAPDLDIQSYFTHRGHEGVITCLAACPASTSFSTGGRITGDGWVFSGGQDGSIRVWERGRVDPKAMLEGHTDSIWALCVLPGTCAAVFGQEPSISSIAGDRVLLVSGSADQSIKVWAVSAPPQLSSPQNAPGGSTRRGVGGSRRHSITSGSNFPSSPQPSMASGTPFHYTLVHSIEWPRGAAASPTCISPLGTMGENFVVGYSDSSILIFDTRTGEEVVGMASSETYDGTSATGINSVVVTSSGASTNPHPHAHHEGASGGMSIESEDENVVHGATGSSKDGGVEGVVISGHEDRYVRFFDANSGQCTYSMLAHPASIASLSLSPDQRELVSAGHDASLRFWSLEKRSCIQEINSHRMMRGEGVVCVVWSADGRWVVSGGGDGAVKVFGR